MSASKQTLLVSIIFFYLNTFSELTSNLYYRIENKYSVPVSYLKIENNDIYKSYLLADDEKILVEDNIDEMRPLASLTKIMTAIVALDNIKDLNEKIKVTKKQASIPYGAKIKAGQVYTVEELLKLILIKSTNAAAQVLADYVSPDFVSLMNEKAREIGIEDLHYCSVHGLPPSYTNSCMDMGSARAILKLSKYAIKNYEPIAEIVKIKNIRVKNQELENTNDLLENLNGIKGIKTGYHNSSKYNISIYYENNDDKLFEVILGSDNPTNRSLITSKVIQNYEDVGGIK
ncbi:D-alanyl-D-alanine carboxypeptidase family protein [Caviibacter abscessus]|uniref:D-alanyl-D-alanine carboxypeptidase family protein n=1 Tax=Caviibacter abscessus TaxID=1766719 RepID=UPI00082B288B|nr:serine hydrolase [Caviibacter abscessus]